MKKPKPYDPETYQDELALIEFRKEAASRLPSVSEIAQLAAMLTQGNPVILLNPADAARHALNLWQASKEERNTAINKIARLELIRAKESAKQNALPKPKKFPVGFDEFLRLALPKKRLEDRMKLYRETLRASIRHDRCYQGSGGSVIPIEKIPIPTDTDVAEVIARHRATGFDEFQYPLCLATLRKYAEYLETQSLKKRAKAGAAGKWGKNNPDEK